MEGPTTTTDLDELSPAVLSVDLNQTPLPPQTHSHLDTSTHHLQDATASPLELPTASDDVTREAGYMYEVAHSERSWEVVSSRGTSRPPSIGGGDHTLEDEHTDTFIEFHSPASFLPSDLEDALMADLSVTATGYSSDASSGRRTNLDLLRGEPDSNTIAQLFVGDIPVASYPLISPVTSRASTPGLRLGPETSTASLTSANSAPLPPSPPRKSDALFDDDMPLSGALAAVQAIGEGAARLYSSLADRLCALAARVRAYVSGKTPTMSLMEGAREVWSTVKELARVMQVRIECTGKEAVAIWSPSFAATQDTVMGHLQSAVALAARAAGKAQQLDWGRVSLCVALGTLGLMYVRLHQRNAVLAEKLNERDGEVAELVSRIVQLHRNFTSPRTIPVIRHTSCSMAAWPAVAYSMQ